MSDLALDSDTSQNGTVDESAARKRPKPGERRAQILQALATMLEQPGAERITTSALAAKLEVSEAALYRHFASKAQMFEGLIEFTTPAGNRRLGPGQLIHLQGGEPHALLALEDSTALLTICLAAPG